MSTPVIISFDVEATDDSPTTGSVVSIGMVAIRENADPESDFIVDEKQVYIREYNSRSDRCMRDFWQKFGMDKLEYTQDPIRSKHVKEAVVDIYNFVENIRNNPAYIFKGFAAKPAAYDWQWLNTIFSMHKTDDMKSLGFKAKCISQMIDDVEMAYNKEYVMNVLKECPHGWTNSHDSLEDAKYQGWMYLVLRKSLYSKR